jgi:antirestriction protein ArdC
MKREEAKLLTDQALTDLQQALAAGHSDTLMRFLDYMGRFHRYSWNNCMLIAHQRPDASYVAGFHRWLDMGRYVRKGETGIAILAPMICRNKDDASQPEEKPDLVLRGFKVVYVFDVSQTEGEELPELTEIHGDPGTLLPRLEEVIRQSGMTLTVEALPSDTQGMCRKGEIIIAEALPVGERFAVLVHELAHAWMHLPAEDARRDKTVCETEAEAVAYVVCRAFGLDCSTRSSDYIQLPHGDDTTLAQSLQRIQSTATRVIRALDETQPATAA